MPIRFDTEKCWIRDPDSLRIKRYLSETRSYFREGRWIRECFQSFFPGIRTDEEGFLFYDLTTLQPPVTAVKAACLEQTLIPEALLDSFQLAVDAFDRSLQKKGLHFNEEMAGREFTLPDPEIHPELYWVVETDSELRLIILWGLHSEIPGANLRIASLMEKLYFRCEGKAQLRRVDSDPEPFPSPKSIPQHPGATPSGSEGNPSDPRNPAHPRPNGPLRAAMRTLGIAALCALGLVGFSELSLHYVGPQLTVNEALVEPGGPEGPAFTLQPGESVIDGNLRLVASESPVTVSMPRLPKAGRYSFPILASGSRQPVRTLTATFNPQQDDMHQGPVASLRLSRLTLPAEVPLKLNMESSFHEENGEPLRTFIAWGEAAETAAAFMPVDRETQILSHAYAKPGTYRVQLLVIDPAGEWDHDDAFVEVVDASTPTADPVVANLAPVMHAALIGLFPHEGGVRAILDLSRSWDPDGTLDKIEIDWGDGSAIETLPFPTGWRIHDYRGQNNRITLRIDGMDNHGQYAAKALHLFLDFQSAAMRSSKRLEVDATTAPFAQQWIQSGPDQLRLIQHTASALVRHQQPLRFEILPPATQPFAPLLNLRWQLTGATGPHATHQGGNALEVLASEDRYRLVLHAQTPDGAKHTLEHVFRVQTHDRMDWHFRAMQWWHRNLPFLSISHHLNSG